MKDLVQEAIVIWDIRYCSGTAKDSQLGGGEIFLYLCLQTMTIIDLKEFNDAEHVYLNVSPQLSMFCGP